jgi:hypothetical protein
MGKYGKYIPKKQLLNWGKNLKISTAMLRWPDGDAIQASSEMRFKNEWIRNIYIYIPVLAGS